MLSGPIENHPPVHLNGSADLMVTSGMDFLSQPANMNYWLANLQDYEPIDNSIIKITELEYKTCPVNRGVRAEGGVLLCLPTLPHSHR